MFYIRNRLTKFLLNLNFSFAKIIAIAPVQFDFKTGEVIKSPHILVYTACINIVYISLMPILFRSNFDEIELFRRKPLTASINRVYVFSMSLTQAIIIISNWVQRKHLNRCIEDFYSIQREHFAQVKVSSCLRGQFDIMVLSKFIITVYQICTIVYQVFALNPVITVQFCLLALYVVLAQIMLLVTPNPIILGVLLARMRFRILNEQLYMTVRQIKLIHAKCEAKPHIGMRMQVSCDLADKIDEIARCHHRNTKFVNKVTRIYQFPLLLIIAFFFISNIIFTFFVLTFINGKDIRTTAFRTLFSAQAILVNAMEFGMLAFACDGTVKAADYPFVLLSQLTELYPAVVDERLLMSLEQFSLNLMREKLQFKLCGLFCVDRKLMTMMASSMFMYLLILIQLDYKNLFT